MKYLISDLSRAEMSLISFGRARWEAKVSARICRFRIRYRFGCDMMDSLINRPKLTLRSPPS
jgi:hypothetical protein